MPTEERLAELTERLERGIRELYDSGQYAAYLSAMSKFHHYSFANALLILLQCPTASRVAGFHTWKKEFGRQVKRGEKGIQILAPCPAQRFQEVPVQNPDTGQPLQNPDGTPKTETRLVPTTRFKIVYVFDISQTEGRALPALSVSELTGDVENFQAMYDGLAADSPVPVTEGFVPGEAKGYYSPSEGRIVLRHGMSQMQTLKTLVHEIAHAKLHDPEKISPEERKAREEKEVEAESVAYVVCQYFGIDTSDYSFGYVAGWSRGKELAELKASLDTIHSTAGEIISALEHHCMERQGPAPPVPNKQNHEYQR